MTQFANKLPDVLSEYHFKEEHMRHSAISVLRALKHIRERFIENLPEGTICNEDMVAIDDLDIMIDSFRRSC
jgi:hypothetical protein